MKSHCFRDYWGSITLLTHHSQWLKAHCNGQTHDNFCQLLQLISMACLLGLLMIFLFSNALKGVHIHQSTLIHPHEQEKTFLLKALGTYICNVPNRRHLLQSHRFVIGFLLNPQYLAWLSWHMSQVSTTFTWCNLTCWRTVSVVNMFHSRPKDELDNNENSITHRTDNVMQLWFAGW